MNFEIKVDTLLYAGSTFTPGIVCVGHPELSFASYCIMYISTAETNIRFIYYSRWVDPFEHKFKHSSPFAPAAGAIVPLNVGQAHFYKVPGRTIRIQYRSTLSGSHTILVSVASHGFIVNRKTDSGFFELLEIHSACLQHVPCIYMFRSRALGYGSSSCAEKEDDTLQNSHA